MDDLLLKLSRLLIAGICFIVALGALGGIGVFGWQAFEYLKFGVWTPLSIITVLKWMDITWAYYPYDWSGLHTVLEAIPLSLIFLPPLLLILFLISID